MALILDDYSEISAHVWSDLGYLICSMYFVCSIEFTNLFFFFGIDLLSFMYTFGTSFGELPSNISTMVLSLFVLFSFLFFSFLGASKHYS